MYISHAKGRASTNLPGLTLRPHKEKLLERDFFAWVSSLSTQAEVGAITFVLSKQFFPVSHAKWKASTVKHTCRRTLDCPKILFSLAVGDDPPPLCQSGRTPLCHKEKTSCHKERMS